MVYVAPAIPVRLSLLRRMAIGYQAMEVFAVGQWSDAVDAVNRNAGPDRDESAAYGSAVMQREFWHDQAERARGLAELVGAIDAE
jgi:hypothetical protein